MICGIVLLLSRELVEVLQRQGLCEPVLLNVNVPDVTYAQLRGTVVTRLGKRHKAEPVLRAVSPRNETVFWVGAAGAAQDAGEGTDFYAVHNHQVSVTPLQIDLTHNGQLSMVREWLAR
jgi:5'-nucleotidase